MTKIGNFILPLLFAIFAAAPAIANVQVQSSVDREKVGVGDDFIYTISVISDSGNEIQTPRPPDLTGFQVLENWDSTSISQKLMPGPNGMDFQTQHRREFNYRLKAVKPGRITIGAFDIVIDGQAHQTQPLLMNVAKTSLGQSQQQQNAGNMPTIPGMPDADSLDQAEAEMFRQLLQHRMGQMAQPPGMGRQQGPMAPAIPKVEPQLRTMPTNPNEAFFVQVEVDKTEVYEGEQITASWYILTRGQMETLDRVSFPSLHGFWKEVIEEAPSIQFTEEIINGVPYRKALLASHALFPIKPGTAIIDEYKIKSRIRNLQQGYGGIVGLGNAYEYTKSSQRVEIKVKPLPLDGRPSNFTGAVGTYQMNASVDSQTVPAQQPFDLKLRFEGEGNAKAIELPAIDWPKSLELYDTKSDSQFFKNGHSYKQFDLLIIPRAEGKIEIPAISIAIFNPKTGKYEEKKTDPIELTVVANANGQSVIGKTTPTPGAPTVAPAAAVTPGNFLPEPIVTFHTAGFAGMGLVQNPVVWVALYLCVILLLAVKAKFELAHESNRRNLQEALNKKFKVLDKTVRGGDPRKIGAEVTNAFSLVLGDIAGEVGASEEMGKVIERIPPSLRRDFGVQILKLHDVFQIMAFAPTEALGDLAKPERFQKEVKEAKDLLQKIVKRSGEEANVPAKD